MALKFNVEDSGGPKVTVRQRLYITEDGRLVGEDAQERRWLFCPAGSELLRDTAKRYGLLDEAEPEPEPEPAPKKSTAPSGQKQTARKRTSRPSKKQG